MLTLVNEPAYKDHLCIRTTFCWSPGWSLQTSFAVFHYGQMYSGTPKLGPPRCRGQSSGLHFEAKMSAAFGE